MNEKRKFIQVTAAEVTGGELVLTTGLTNRTIYNGERNVLCIATEIPASATVVPVVVEINGVNIPLQDVLGNTLQSDQIQSRCAFPGIWGTLPLHFKLCSCVRKSQASERQVVPATTDAG